jgi:hypothetical protein
MESDRHELCVQPLRQKFRVHAQVEPDGPWSDPGPAEAKDEVEASVAKGARLDGEPLDDRRRLQGRRAPGRERRYRRAKALRVELDVEPAPEPGEALVEQHRAEGRDHVHEDGATGAERAR